MKIQKIVQFLFISSFLIHFAQGNCKFQFVEKEGKCVHKNLFENFSVYDAVALGLILIFALLGSIGGAACGILFVPIYLLILNFNTQDSISSSICMIGLTQILRMIISVRQRHPFRNKPIIDYSFAALIAPPTFLGNVIGVILNVWFPNLIIKIMFTILIAFACQQQTEKGIQVWKKEKSMINKKEIYLETDAEKMNKEQAPIIVYKKNQVNVELQTNISYLYQKYKTKNSLNENNIDKNIEDDTEFVDSNIEPEEIPKEIKDQYDKYINRESRYVYWNRLIPIFLAFFLVAFTTLLKGSKNFDSIIGVETCSGWYWFLTIISVPFIIIIIFFIIRQYTQENYIQQQVYQASIKEDIEWTKFNIIKFQILAVIVGFFQAMFGIGGAMIWSPILISQKLPVDVITYTIQFLVLLGAVNNLIQYLVMGNIIWDYAVFSSLLAGLSFAIGLKLLMPYFIKKNKRSIIVFALAIIEFSSLIGVLISAIIQAKKDNDNGKNIWAMKNFCN